MRTIKELVESGDDRDRLEGWLRRVLEVVESGEDFSAENRYGQEHAAIRALLSSIDERRRS